MLNRLFKIISENCPTDRLQSVALVQSMSFLSDKNTVNGSVNERLKRVPSHPFARLSTRIAIGFVLLLTLSSCSSSRRADIHGKYGGTLELTTDTDIKSLDPAIAYDVPAWSFIRLMYTGLVDYDDATRLVPRGSENWSVSPDGRTYTFHLRRNVYFAGPLTRNRAVTSADYAYEIRRILTKEVASPGMDFYSTIEGAQAFYDGKAASIPGLRTPDPYTLVIHLTAPRSEFLNIMALPFAYAVPHEVIGRYKGQPEFQEHAEGSGPFKLAYWHRNLDIRLDRNPHYFDSSLPYLDRIHEVIGVQPLNSMMMFETGEKDISGITSADFVRITSDPEYKPYINRQVQMALFYVSLNCEMPPLDNLKVRQAINYAIDREKIIRLINNRGVLATGVLPPGMPGYDPGLKGYPHDPNKARQLLKEAGFANGFKTTLWVRSAGTGGDEMREAQAIQQDLKDVGIDLDLKPVTFAVWLSSVAEEKTVPLSINDWYQDFPDPSDFLDVLLNSKQARPSDGNNSAFYKSAAMDALLAKAAAARDPAKRLRIYQQANVLAVHDAPWIFMYYPVSYTLRRPWVCNYSQHPVWLTRYEHMWLSK